MGNSVPNRKLLLWGFHTDEVFGHYGVNLADLMRVEGVGEEYADLLEEAGVDSVKELRNRRADNLHEAMLKTNDAKNLVRRPPSLNEVEKWVEQAKSLPPIITH